MKAVVAAFNQEKALVGAFSVITNLRMELFEAIVAMRAGVGLIGSYFAAGEMNNKNSHKTNQIKACSKY